MFSMLSRLFSASIFRLCRFERRPVERNAVCKGFTSLLSGVVESRDVRFLESCLCGVAAVTNGSRSACESSPCGPRTGGGDSDKSRVRRDDGMDFLPERLSKNAVVASADSDPLRRDVLDFLVVNFDTRGDEGESSLMLLVKETELAAAAAAALARVFFLYVDDIWLIHDTDEGFSCGLDVAGVAEAVTVVKGNF